MKNRYIRTVNAYKLDWENYIVGSVWRIYIFDKEPDDVDVLKEFYKEFPNKIYDPYSWAPHFGDLPQIKVSSIVKTTESEYEQNIKRYNEYINKERGLTHE